MPEPWQVCPASRALADLLSPSAATHHRWGPTQVQPYRGDGLPAEVPQDYARVWLLVASEVTYISVVLQVYFHWLLINMYVFYITFWHSSEKKLTFVKQSLMFINRVVVVVVVNADGNKSLFSQPCTGLRFVAVSRMITKSLRRLGLEPMSFWLRIRDTNHYFTVKFELFF